MAKNIIHIYGAAGSGTSALGRKICDELDYKFMDTDDCFWLDTNPPYTVRRERQERFELMLKDIKEAEDVVISGSLVGWGDELIPLFSLVIRLETDTDIRIQRIKMREKERFGKRIEFGGDMYKQHMDFIAWAEAYDTADLSMRSKAEHDEWQKLLRCKQILLNGADSLDNNYEIVREEIL